VSRNKGNEGVQASRIIRDEHRSLAAVLHDMPYLAGK
jgi:hypothetical protein